MCICIGVSLPSNHSLPNKLNFVDLYIITFLYSAFKKKKIKDIFFNVLANIDGCICMKQVHSFQQNEKK